MGKALKEEEREKKSETQVQLITLERSLDFCQPERPAPGKACAPPRPLKKEKKITWTKKDKQKHPDR